MEETKVVEEIVEKPKKKSTKKKKDATKEEPKIVKGVVFNCERLNVRSYSSKTARVVSVLKKGAIVTVDLEKSDPTFYFVTLESGRTGYCMKKYLQIG